MKDILAEIISIGDEILYGQILDTNSQWISFELDKAGIKTVRKTTVPDLEPEILKAFSEAESRADIVLITGGLGPTNDDLTKPALARYFDASLVINPQALKELEALFERRGFKMTVLNRRQAELPDKCRMISNTAGTAAGMWFEKNGKVFISMPGVPHEMKTMMRDIVVPDLVHFFNPPALFHKMILTVGIGESWLADKIKDWESQLPAHIKLAYLPNYGQVRLRLTASGNDPEQLKTDVAIEVEKVCPLIEKHIFGYDNETLEQKIGELLSQESKTLALAESCTGGFLSHTITSVPGSSRYFQGAIIPYSNELKIKQLGIKAATIENYGAVSEETVHEMANNVRELLRADIGISSSGIAGPGGGTPEKPVGTVWIALADGYQTITKKLSLTSDRMVNINLTCVAALNLLRESLSKKN